MRFFTGLYAALVVERLLPIEGAGPSSLRGALAGQALFVPRCEFFYHRSGYLVIGFVVLAGLQFFD